MDKQIDILSYRVSPNIKEIYDNLPAESKQKVKLNLIEKILVEDHISKFNLKEYAKEHGVSLQIEENDEV